MLLLSNESGLYVLTVRSQTGVEVWETYPSIESAAAFSGCHPLSTKMCAATLYSSIRAPRWLALATPSQWNSWWGWCCFAPNRSTAPKWWTSGQAHPTMWWSHPFSPSSHPLPWASLAASWPGSWMSPWIGSPATYYKKPYFLWWKPWWQSLEPSPNNTIGDGLGFASLMNVNLWWSTVTSWNPAG